MVLGWLVDSTTDRQSRLLIEDRVGVISIRGGRKGDDVVDVWRYWWLYSRQGGIV